MASLELWFDTDKLPLNKGSYELSMLVEQKKDKTEGGTVQREIQRVNVPHLSVSCVVDDTWYQKLSTYNGTGSITVSYYSPITLAQATFSGFIENLKYSLKVDHGTKKYWDVSFEVTAY